jgi:hypothetical protein
MIRGKSNVTNRARLVLPALGLVWLLLASLILATELAKAPLIEIAWSTETEFDTVGFNVWRSDKQEGEYRRVNDLLIPGAADAAAGAEYSYVDEEVERGKTYYYRLEDVAFNNTTVQYEIVSATAQGVSGLALVIAIVCVLIGVTLILSNLIGQKART